MINKEVFIKTLLEKAYKLPLDHYLDIRSYKRDRIIYLIRKTEDHYHIIENGFYKDEFQITFSEIRSLFKKILKKEFPRSHRIRLYTMGLYNKNIAKEIKRKNI